jgi:hypothetical protein
LIESLKNSLRKFLSFSVQFGPVRWLLAGWYRLSLVGLRWIVRGEETQDIKTIYTRHQNWILGISDIDLIVLFDDGDTEQDRTLFITFWRRYHLLRLLFPMLCNVSEIRWIPVQRLQKHPLHDQPEARLLLNPEQWVSVYTKPGEDIVRVPVFDPARECSLPLTMFLEFNLYGYLQKQLFSDEIQPGLRIDRMAKCAVKIVQHLHYLQSGEYVPVSIMQAKLSQDLLQTPWNTYAELLGGLISPAENPQGRDREIARSVFNLLRELSSIHEVITGTGEPVKEPPMRMPSDWSGTGFGSFLADAEQAFGDRMVLVAFKSPYKQYHKRLFIVIRPEYTFENFYEFIRFARNYHDIFLEEKVIAAATTPVLLTSQFHGLWGSVALEGYILQAQGVYAPRGGLELRQAEESWTLRKIRESVAVFEEFYLPFLMSPGAKGIGMDICKIYERAETEMLFHYYAYLKDQTAYLELMQGSDGSVDDIIAWGCAQYGNEIGIQDWQPLRFIDSYPYLKKMIRLIDEMALKKLESIS